MSKRKVRILFFIETLEGGGAEKVLRNLVNNMDFSRFDITVQTVWPCEDRWNLLPGIRYKSMYKDRNRLTHIRYRLEAATGIAYLLHIKNNYDIECAYLECGTTKILAASSNKKAVKLAWVHCDLNKIMPDPVGFARKTRRYYQEYDKVVCVSEAGRQSFIDLFGDDIPSVIIYNTVDCQEILEKSSENCEELRTLYPPVIVSLGRLSKPKNYMRLLQAHTKLLQDGIPHSLLIVGEGQDRPKLEKYIADHNLQDTVCLTGFKNNPYPYIKNADILACSSSYECFSTFITEGLILGKPIVTTDVSGMRELLGDSECGLITKNDDDAFYMGLKEMLLNSKLRESYSEKSILRGNSFSTKELVRRTEKFFIDELKKKRSR